MATVHIEMDNKQILTLAATIGTCVLIGLEQHLPPHAALARKIRSVESSLQGLGALTGTLLDDKMIDIGTNAWGKAMEYVAKHIKEADSGSIQRQSKVQRGDVPSSGSPARSTRRTSKATAN